MIKQCSNCRYWVAPLATSACNIYDDLTIVHDFKVNAVGTFYCDDWEYNIPVQLELDFGEENEDS